MKREHLRYFHKPIKVAMLCIALIATIQTYGQIPGPEPEITTPDIWSFVKYGGSQPNLYTGTVRADIPIYTYKDPDFTIPITASYASNGFIPNMHAGSMGLGWFLNVGGCITREINSVPDEQLQEQDGNNQLVKAGGFFWYHKLTNKDNNSLPERTYLNTNHAKMYIYNSNNDRFYDSESDVYSFNFMGHSGKFIMGPDSIYVFNTSGPQGEYKVDMSDFASSNNSGLTGWSIITITTGDGYKYIFKSYLIRSYETIAMDDTETRQLLGPYRETKPEFLAKTWLLTEIIAPNGRQVTFEYSDAAFSESVKFTGQYNAYITHEWGSIQGGYFEEHHTEQLKDYNLNLFELASKRLTKIIIHGHEPSILIDRMVIELSYSEREEKEEYKHPIVSYRQPLVQQKQLDKISILTFANDQGGQNYKEFKFKYGYPNKDGNQVLLLKEVNIPGEGIYKMSYYNENLPFPFQGTSGFDHWGYYNNRNSYSISDAVTSTIIDESTYRESFLSEEEEQRRPRPTGSIYGMLHTLEYPTGGYTEYEYEPHSYSGIVLKDYSSQNKPSLRLCDETIAGGVRVKRITDYTRPGTVGYSKEYIYNNNISGTSSSSGNMLHMPRYRLEFHSETYLVPSVNTNHYIVSITDLHAFSKTSYHIEYSKVYEKYNDGSYVAYNFSNYRTIPDKVIKPGNFVSSYRVSYPMYANYYFACPISLNSQRGKITSKEYYDADNHKCKEEKYTYDLHKKLKYIETIKTTFPQGDVGYIHETFVEDYPLVSRTETIDGVTSKQDFKYNDAGQLISITSTRSDGKRYQKEYQFPLDQELAERNEMTRAMIEKNIICLPLKEQESVYDGQDKKLLQGKIHEYKYSSEDFDYLYGEKDVIVLKQTKTTELTQPTTVPDFQFTPSSRPSVQYAYDSFGNICRITDRNGVTTHYLWGYYGMYVTAIVENAEMDNIHLRITYPSAGVNLAAGHLRNIPGVLVTRYYYSPFVGITDKIDPSGRVTTYEYDSNWKLKAVRDDNGNLVESYRYDIKNK